MLTGPMESMHMGWRCSLLTHALCGQLTGLQRYGTDMDANSHATCKEVLSQCITCCKCCSNFISKLQCATPATLEI
jgi:hypothetical protein